MKNFIYVITFLALISLFSSKRIRGPLDIKHNFNNEQLQLIKIYEQCLINRMNKKESIEYDLICSKELANNMSKLRDLNQNNKIGAYLK